MCVYELVLNKGLSFSNIPSVGGVVQDPKHLPLGTVTGREAKIQQLSLVHIGVGYWHRPNYLQFPDVIQY